MQVRSLARSARPAVGPRPFVAIHATKACVKPLVTRDVQARAAEDEAAPAPSAAAAAPAAAPAPADAAATVDTTPEEVFYEGSGSNLELALSVLLAGTVIYLPLTMASIGRRLWIKIKVTNKRIIVENSSPAFKGQTQVAFSKIKEIRTVPRAFGAWGDMVVVLKDGSRLELLGVEKYDDIKRHIESCIYD